MGDISDANRSQKNKRVIMKDPWDKDIKHKASMAGLEKTKLDTVVKKTFTKIF